MLSNTDLTKPTFQLSKQQMTLLILIISSSPFVSYLLNQISYFTFLHTGLNAFASLKVSVIILGFY